MKIFCLLSFFTFSLIATCQKDLPKIMIGIVVDQMCYDYLYRFEKNYSENGFKKLMTAGSHLKNMHFNYIPTYTGPGHASIYTGTTPNSHGIIGNDWLERSSNQNVNCVGDNSVKGIESSPTYGASSPHRLNTNTVTDQLKMSYPKSKVISISIKDRGAILPGGHNSDGTYWFDYGKGTFITSSYYKTELPKWLQDFNQKNNAAYYANVWTPLLKEDAYSVLDDSPYERILGGKTAPTFPYDIPSLCVTNSSLQPFTMSPYANTMLTDLALNAIENENLGKDEFPDMLCISYSSPDIAGHAFGPDSKEIEDMYIRLDLELARFISSLEKSFGKDGFILFLTADHGVVPVPQKLVDEGLPGGYVFVDQIINKLRTSCKSSFGIDFILGQDNLNIYLDYDLLESSKDSIDINQVLTLLEKEILNTEGVKQTARRSELIKRIKSEDHLLQMLREGFDPKRSGDLLLILEYGYLPKSSLSLNPHKGTSHGSGYTYDTHVPCLWYGAGIRKNEILQALNITDIGPTLLELLNLPKSESMSGSPIDAILKP
mgnify:CR=1 FL=1